MILSGVKNNNTGPRNEGSGGASLPKNPGVDKGPQPLMFNPALTTQGELPSWGKRRPPGGCASERMKT